MSRISHKWVFGLGLAALFADLVVAHPALGVKNEYQYKDLVPPNSVLVGFTNERQWLFAHRKFRNQCVLEALAAERKQAGDNVGFASARLSDSISLAHLRAPNDNQYRP
jgi:hypothetical protein